MLPALSDNSLKADHEAGIDPHRGTGSVVAGAIVDVERAVEATDVFRQANRPPVTLAAWLRSLESVDTPGLPDVAYATWYVESSNSAVTLSRPPRAST